MLEVDTRSRQQPDLLAPNDLAADEQFGIVGILEEDDQATTEGNPIEAAH